MFNKSGDEKFAFGDHSETNAKRDGSFRNKRKTKRQFVHVRSHLIFYLKILVFVFVGVFERLVYSYELEYIPLVERRMRKNMPLWIRIIYPGLPGSPGYLGL